MKSMLELAYQYPAGFWVCDECDGELYDQAAEDGMGYVDLYVQYVNDLSVEHCTRCDYAPETGLSPVQLSID